MNFNEWWDWQIRSSNGVVPSNECKAWAVLAYFAGAKSSANTEVEQDQPLKRKPEPSIEELKQRYEEDISFLKTLVVSRFDENGEPEFRQGCPVHELEDVVTAEQCRQMYLAIKNLQKHISHLTTHYFNRG